MAAVGLTLPTSLLSEWLVLAPVMALEVGAALALVLVHAVSSVRPASETANVVEQTADSRAGQPPQSGSAPDTTKSPSSFGNPVPVRASKRTPSKARKRTRHKGGKGVGGGQSGKARPANIVDLLKARGGHFKGGQRGIAKALGLSKSRINEILHELAASGAVRLSKSRTGTTVALAA